MVAARRNGQIPMNGKLYTPDNWNTLSQLEINWGQSYQWSKAQREKGAWDLSKELSIFMMLCPSFVFRPPFGDTSSYYATLVKQWVRGESAVHLRLC